MPKKFKPIPAFASEAEERKFWESHDTADYFDLRKARRVSFPNLKPSTVPVALNLPTGLVERIKTAADQRAMPYESLIEMWLTEKAS